MTFGKFNDILSTFWGFIVLDIFENDSPLQILFLPPKNCWKPHKEIVVIDGDASQSVERRCYWDAYDDMGTFFGDVANVPVEMGKVGISSTFENVLGTSPSCPRRCWDVPVAYDDMETRLRTMVGNLWPLTAWFLFLNMAQQLDPSSIKDRSIVGKRYTESCSRKKHVLSRSEEISPPLLYSKGHRGALN